MNEPTKEIRERHDKDSSLKIKKSHVGWAHLFKATHTDRGLLLDRVEALEAQLSAIAKLPDDWIKNEIAADDTNGHMDSWNKDGYDCAKELQAILDKS
jgi:hypothetical protein